MDTNALLSATLIYDGSGPSIPDQLMPKGGMPQIQESKQMIGTPLELLCEIAVRCCYDSFGRGRTSADFHKHILEVGHLSVVEHAAFTVHIDIKSGGTRLDQLGIAAVFLNKPNVVVKLVGEVGVSVTLNLRHVLEWGQRPGDLNYNSIGAGLIHHAKLLAPTIMSAAKQPEISTLMRLVSPIDADESWVTLLLTGSRGFSHELVRHGDWTAISQRSTRYVDESTSDWVEHPLTAMFFKEADAPARASNGEQVELSLAQRAKHAKDAAKNTYANMVTKLEPWLISKGVDKISARKQARGAARGYLGNALYTEVVFSANCTQWRRMLKQRLNPAADAEIREVFAHALKELQRSKHGHFFNDMSTKPSPDGIGLVLE